MCCAGRMYEHRRHIGFLARREERYARFEIPMGWSLPYVGEGPDCVAGTSCDGIQYSKLVFTQPPRKLTYTLAG